MDGGRMIPPGESKRPQRIIPPLPAKPSSAVDTAPKVSLKERFAKVFTPSGGGGSTNGSESGISANGNAKASSNGSNRTQGTNGADSKGGVQVGNSQLANSAGSAATASQQQRRQQKDFE